MAPLILDGDKLRILRSRTFKVNDVVVFLKNNKLIAHRIIYRALRKNYFIAKGDNNYHSDGKISEKDILGKIDLSHLYLAQSSVYLKELEFLSASFQKEKIEYLILKGLPVHIFVNGTPPERLYLDTDILIKPDFRKLAEVALVKLEYKKERSLLFRKGVKNPAQVTFFKKTAPFPVSIDLHFEPAVGTTKVLQVNIFLPKMQGFTKTLFKEKIKVGINKTEFPILSKETLFIYLCLHFFRHNFSGAHRLMLINDLVENKKLNWKKIAKIVTENKLKKLIFPTFLFLDKYYKTPLPKSFVKDVTPGEFSVFFAKIISFTLSPFNVSPVLWRLKKLFFILLFSSPTNLFFSEDQKNF